MKYCELCRKIKSMKFPKVIIAAAAAVLAMQPDTAWAQEKAEKNEDKASPVNIHGTIRSKYEYQTEEDEGRFEVRNARISVDGQLSPIIIYKAEIDLCDEGKQTDKTDNRTTASPPMKHTQVTSFLYSVMNRSSTIGVSGSPMSCHRYWLWQLGHRHGQLVMFMESVTSSGIS